MWVLYLILTVFIGGLLALFFGAVYKFLTYPYTYVTDYETMKTKKVYDTQYHYKDSELWEPPTYWNFEKTK